MQWNEFVSRFWICADLCPICVCSMMTFNGWEYCCNRICSLSEPNSFLQPRMALEHNGVLLPYPTYGCNICSESAIFNLHFTFECIDGWFHAQSTLKLNSIVHFSLLIIAYIHRELPFAIACERCIWNNEQHIFFLFYFLSLPLSSSSHFSSSCIQNRIDIHTHLAFVFVALSPPVRFSILQSGTVYKV